jgi:ATP-dependent Lhr-like helicase
MFSKLAPFIKEYIYRHGWDELRVIQTEAARVIFETDSNLLLTTPTASGKTEAAFFLYSPSFTKSLRTALPYFISHL